MAANQKWSTQDKVVIHLQINDKITWNQAGKGHYADITEEVLAQALLAVGANQTEPILARRKAPNDGSILGYDVSKAVCYKHGSIGRDQVITQWAVDACDGLIGNALPPLALKTLRIWQSAQAADLQGKASYIRFGIKLLGDNQILNPSLCQAAFDAFNNYCQTGIDETKGGELTVSDLITFSADPNEVATNN